MQKIAPMIAAALMLFSPVTAQSDPVVVELYTSQGCSSCPPADRFLHKLADRDDVIALALHVDYWDYIGWKDIFGSAAHTKRQRAYARVNGRRMIYTPQMIINGAEHVVGNRPRDVVDLIKRHKSDESNVDLRVTRRGSTLRIRAESNEDQGGNMVVQLIRYIPKATVNIKRGENAGKTLSYANVVTEMVELANWDTRKALSIDTPVSGDAPIVVLVQRQNFGPVTAVFRIE